MSEVRNFYTFDLSSSLRISGLTLAGGYGLKSGSHGLAIDNMVRAEVVTAQGDVFTASDEEHTDLCGYEFAGRCMSLHRK